MPKEDTQYKPGEGGRPAGVQNKLTRTVKETVLQVFNKLQENPKHNLTAFAERYPRDFYAIAAKLIPTEINAKLSKIKLEIVRHDKLTERNSALPSGSTSSEPGEGDERKTSL